MKIVILDGYASNPGDLSWEPLRKMGALTVYPRTDHEQLHERAKDAEVVFTNKVAFRADDFARLPKLKYIGVLATGFNIIDLDAARTHGVTVTNVPAYSTDSVAQMTFAHILNITNRIGHYTRLNREGKWSGNADFCYWDTPLKEVAGKTLGIVGLGNIGWKVARIAHEFGMDIFAVTSKNSADLPECIQKTTLDGLLAVSDILTLHCPLTPDTREIINKASLAKMRQGAILINTSRGPLVNECDVADALHSGRLAGYGADVMCSEPPAADNPLLKEPNAFLTPHIAWATFEARERLVSVATDNLKAFLAGKPQNVVSER